MESRPGAREMLSPADILALEEGRFPYIHEAEERTKKKFLKISVDLEIFLKKFLSSCFVPTSPVAGFPLLGDSKQMLD